MEIWSFRGLSHHMERACQKLSPTGGNKNQDVGGERQKNTLTQKKKNMDDNI